MALVAGFCVGLAIMVWRPGVWLFAVPASLPVLNFSPWTGWLMFDEFDLLLLAVLAGGYVRLAFIPGAAEVIKPVWSVRWLIALLAGSGLWALARGLSDADGFNFDWFAGYADAMNSLRVFKSLGFALLFMPLLALESRTSNTRVSQRLASGMVVGLGLVTLAVLWERLAFPGLLDFSTHYRTVALFWEMHVGGAAIDSYLAMATPFVVWALLAARHPVTWTGSAVLAVLAVYAGLTTFSRGVYFAVLGSLLLLWVLLWAQKTERRVERWRVKAGLFLALVLVAEVVVVLGGGSFMNERVANVDHDLGSRRIHWQRGLALLKSPSDWLLGKGIGRLPANYAMQGLQGEFSGEVEIREEWLTGGRKNGYITLRGPRTSLAIGGLYALTQRVALASQGAHRVRLDIRVQRATDVELKWCERHLLYDRHCQMASAHLVPLNSAWQSCEFLLSGPVLNHGDWYAPRLGVFSISVVNAGGVADVDNVKLFGPGPQDLLENGDFSKRLSHWFPAAQIYFLPWHIDNLFLEILIERGVVGLLVFAVCVMVSLWHLVFGRARMQALSPFLAASLSAALLVGLVSSFMDVPRVSFLFFLLTMFSISSVKTDDIQHRQGDCF